MKAKSCIFATVGVLLLVVLIGLILMFALPSQRFSNTGASNTILTIENLHGNFNVVETINSAHACGGDAKSSLDYKFMLLSPSPFPSTLSKNTQYPLTNLGVQGIQAQETGNGCAEQYFLTNIMQYGYCQYHDSSYGWECHITIKAQAQNKAGQIVPEAIFYGLTQGSFDIDSSKVYTEPTIQEPEIIELPELDNNIDTSTDTNNTVTVTQEEVNLVFEELSNLDTTQEETFDNQTQINEIVKTTGLSEQKVKFILENAKETKTPFIIYLVFGLLVILLIVVIIVLLTWRKK